MDEKEEYLDFKANDSEMENLNEYVLNILERDLIGKEREEFMKKHRRKEL